MTTDTTRATVERRGVIALHGDIDRSAEADVTDAYGRVQEPGLTKLVLDFADVSYINSTGIAVIVSVLARARADGVTIDAYGLSDHYRHVFQITRLSDFMTIHDGEDRATGGAA